MKFPLSLSPSKEMGDRTRQKKQNKTIFDLGGNPTHRLSHEGWREQVMGDYDGNCGNVDMKGTN